MTMRGSMKAFGALLLSSWICLLSSVPAQAAWDSDKGCMGCHEGIEQFATTPVMGRLSCTACHMGDGAATALEAAHKGVR